MDFNAARAWSQQDEERHIHVENMKTVQLTLDAFLDRVIGEVIVLMNGKHYSGGTLEETGEQYLTMLKVGSRDHLLVWTANG